MSVLAEILAHKETEVAAARQRLPLTDLQRQVTGLSVTRGFRAALAQAAANRAPSAQAAAANLPAVIAEVKKASPSKGLIRPDFDPVTIARQYQAGGATCLSVLTDEKYFQGHPDYLRQIRAAVALPLLRKDFIIDGYQVYEARAWGADAVLLIVAAFTGPDAGGRSLTDLAALVGLTRSLGMDALVEVHTAEELAVALQLGATLIGINNRNLRTFETKLEVTEQLAARVPPDVLLVSESGIATTADCRRVAAVGAQAVLVGESLMRQPDPAAALRALLGQA
jgi:indole-3-glycerol phosphate synthase